MNKNPFLFRHPVAALVLMFSSCVTKAAPPDLTNGGVPGDTISVNLGPTGLRGWVYHVRENSSESRQIQIKSVASGSPADGILAVNDVILGVSGTGANPVNFASDARKSLANAINDAEARNPATLSLLRWRQGTTTTVTITLQTMGAYSATAPYNCPKSALILQQGLQAIMAGESAGRYSFGTISLLAANNPLDPANAARMARAQTEARALIPSEAQMQQMMSDERDTGSPWQRGHTLIVLAEYYLLTRDAPALVPDTTVLPAIEAYAVNIARNSSLFGTMGHIFATKNSDGSDNGPMGGVYGPVNSSGMPCFLGLLLARECGITHPTIDPAITRMSRFFSYYAGRGAVPYGEHEAYWQRHESNGKSGLAAICFHLIGNRAEEGKFNAKMAVAATTEREMGHTGAFFNYLWSPLGTAAGGEQAAAAHFSGIRWMLDLNRRWDGKFDYDCLSGEGPNSGSTYSDFRMSSAALLTYALPLRQLRITGKNHDSNRFLTSTDVTEAAAVDGYDAVPLTTNQLIADLGNWSPMVQRRAAEQLATRSIDTATLNQITALANDPNGTSRIGACFTLGKISNSTTANARAATLAALLTDPENHVRFMAAEAMRYLPDSARLSQLSAILSAAASTAKPLMPFDEEDPLHFAHGRLAMLLFYSGNAYGPKGVIWGSKINSPTVINRSLLYPAIRAIAANPVGQARSCLTETYRNLTTDDVNALAGSIVESVRFGAPSDKMFNGGVRMGGLDALEKFKRAEGVPLSMIYMVDDTRGDAYTYGLGVLKKYGGGSTTVTPDPQVVEFCQALLGTSNAAAAQEVINAIAASSNPPPLTPFKSIQSATADAPSLNLPSTQTTLRANAADLAEGDIIFTWRKIHGAGNVTFTPNGTAAAKDCAIQYANVPGSYLFEVTVSDSRGLTEVYGTVATTLRNPDGTLPPNSPPGANPQTVNAIPGDAKSITLTGTDPEGYPLVFTVTSQPAHGTLTGTAPNLTYTADIFHTGADSFTFQAMDSEGQTASATVSINVSTANAELLVHEPFDYAAGGLNGKGGTTEIGFATVWHATTAQVVTNSLSHGSLPVSGGSIGNLNGGSNHYGGTRALSASALSQKGLLDDGATLWFSVIMGYGTNYAVDPPVAANMTNSRLALALANSGFNTGNYKYYINDESSQLGSGIGVTLGRFNSANGKVVATHFRDASKGTSGWEGNVFGNVPVSTVGANSHRLVVGKITWGAASDIIELYEPDTNMNLNLPTSTLEVNVDQSKFDVITWVRGDTVTMDEIRFGDSLAAVVGLDLTPPDTTPPNLSGITDDRGGETMQQGMPVSYTHHFSEAMDVSTISAADFGNAGTSAIQINSVIQAVPGVVMVNVTPVTSGTLQFQVVQGAVLSDLAGNPLNTTAAITDDTIITVNPATTSVPFVLGMSQSEAEAEITTAGLAVGLITTQHHSTVPAGEVINQNPAGGASVAAGSSVDLLVSLGPVMTTAPNVTGLAQATAESNITAANLVVGTVSTQNHATVPSGTVISQSPVSGASVLTGTAVDLVISLGDTTPPAPDPMTFAVAPHATGPSGISMTATTATDPNGVEYFFTCVSGGGNNSGWQDSPVYADSGLTPTTEYTYMVTARDKSSNQNATQPSAPSSATTLLANGIWIFDGDDNWSNSARWTDATVANGMDATASFIVDLTDNRTVTLDSNRSIGHIVKFDTDSSDHTLTIGGAENTLTLATGSGSPTITNNDPGAARRLIISRPVAGGNGLTIAGVGMVRLDNSGNSYTGVTNISQGILSLGVDGSITGSSAVTIAPGAVLDATAKPVYEIPATQPVTFGVDAANSGSCGMISAGELHIGNAVVNFGITGTLDDPVYVLASYSSLHGGSFATAPVPPGYVLDYDYQGNKIALVQIVYTPEIAVEQPGLTPIANGGSKDFGTVTTGSETSLVFTIRNTGNADLSLDGTPRIDITGTNANDFSVIAQPAATVAAGGTTTFTVRFAPTEAGARVALLSIANNSGGNPFAISLGGTGENPYDTWSGGAAFDADANGDGVDNGLAFLLGAANKDENAVTRLPAVSQIGGALKLTFKCLNATKRGTAVLKVQYSRDLGLTDLWDGHDSAVVPGEAPATATVGGVDFVTSVFDANLNHVEATVPASAAEPGSKLFSRLKATP